MFRRFLVTFLAALSLASPARAVSIFTGQVPASGDISPNAKSVELGVRFRADAAGHITGLRFFKTAGNTGTHTGHLWSSTGALLGSLTFSSETSTGWQTAAFASSIPIQAGLSYVASYHTAASYAVTRMTFGNAGIDNPPLHALQDGIAGPNGVYAYATGAIFPNKGTRSSNNWVDVLYTASADLTAPSVSISSPAGGAALRGTIAVTAAASDDVAVTTVQFMLDGAPLGPPVLASPYATSWDTVASGDGVHVLTAAAWDAAGNASTSAAVAVVVDNTPPLISAVAAAVLGPSSATVTWLTNEPATAQVEYGTSTSYASLTALDASTITAHSHILTGLSTATLHHYRARSVDNSGNLAFSGDFTFTTYALPSDSEPPSFSSVAVTGIGRSSATVSWLTNEPATARVEYGTSTSYGSLSALDASTVTAHVRVLHELTSGTLYHYRVASTDTAGNAAVSGDGTFTTAVFAGTVPPTVVSLTFDDGTASHLLARDILDSRGVKGTFYINSGRIGAVPAYMTAAQIQSLATGGHEIGGHTINHLNLTTLGAAQLQQQICADRAALQSLGWSVVSLAYPFGAFNAAAKATAASCGYANARTVGGLGCAGCPRSAPVPPADAFAVPTPDSVRNTTTLADMQKMVLDAEEAGGGWVPVVMHLVCENCDPMAVSTGTLAAFVDWVQPRASAGTVIKTMAEAMGVSASSPTVTISSPITGSVITGTVAVAAAAYDDVAVATVQFRLDGADLGPPDASAPYAFVWDTASSSAGLHALTAVAWDAGGLASTAPLVSVTVDNAPPLLSSAAVTGVGRSSATVAWRTDEPANSRVEFGTTTAYGSSSALDASTVTAHTVILSGLTPATTYHLRALSADAGGSLGVSGDLVLVTGPDEPAGACSSSAGAWENVPLAPQVSSFTFAFDASAAAPGMNGSVGLSSGPAGSLGNLAAAVRFNSSGFIDVRYSTAYARMTPVAYATGTLYHFDMRVTASGHLFDVEVSSPGGERQLLARSYPFHSSQSTVTVLNNLGLVAATGGLTACNPVVSASTVPWWDGVREVYPTAAGSKVWYASWNNGLNRSFGRAFDPLDPWFDGAHGTASYIVDADSGVFKISGTTPRMYVHHPQFVTGASSLTVTDSHAKQWHDVELTVYGMRVADGGVAYAGLAGAVRANHGITGSETVQRCDSRGMGARFRYDGHLDLEKETVHPTSFAILNSTTSLWPSGTSMPFNVWIGYKLAVYDLPNGNVKIESWMDMSDGAGGGSWVKVKEFEDNGANWGGVTGCAADINPQERLTNASNRPGTESGIPNSSVYLRSDSVGTNGLLYKKMSVREISPFAGGPGPLAALAAPPPAAVAPAAAEDFVFRDLYVFPNPSRRGERVTIRLQAGLADAVEVAVYDLSGRRVAGGGADGPVFLDDGNGKGPQFTYDYHWDASGAASAVYFYSVSARKQGQAAIGRTGKVALIK